jgi:ankyrin repeat protein
MTLLIEASLRGRTKIVKYMLEQLCNVNLDAQGKVFHFDSIVDGATALWCAAGQYIYSRCHMILNDTNVLFTDIT